MRKKYFDYILYQMAHDDLVVYIEIGNLPSVKMIPW